MGGAKINKVNVDMFGVGLGILLGGMGIGLAINWASQDPVVSACEDAIEELKEEDRTKALLDCIKAGKDR